MEKSSCIICGKHRKFKMKKIYSIICSKYRKIKNPEISYLFYKTLLLLLFGLSLEVSIKYI